MERYHYALILVGALLVSSANAVELAKKKGAIHIDAPNHESPGPRARQDFEPPLGEIKPVPPRPEIGGGAGGPGAIPDLTRSLTLNQLGSADTINEFTVEVDIERPTQIVGVRVAEELTEEQPTGELLPPHVPLGPVSLKQYAGAAERSTFLATAGDAAELKVRAQATLAESEWFVTAQTATTRYALGDRVLAPAQVVPVYGLGSVYSGDYLVAAVTHTIDHNQHAMELDLRRNALGPGALIP